MNNPRRFSKNFGCAIIFLTLMVSGNLLAQEEVPVMGFFVTSVGLGDGANLGGLEGADAHCQALAAANGGDNRTWHAYLSTQSVGNRPAVNARDRIGTGPWHNAKGDQIGANIDDLHYNNANIKYEMALDETGNTINSGAMGDSPSRHDILTGSQLDGTAFAPGKDMTCSNFTSNSEGSAMVGHSDRFRRTTPGSPWNTAHPSRGCSLENLESSGGAGLFYCFAID